VLNKTPASVCKVCGSRIVPFSPPALTGSTHRLGTTAETHGLAPARLLLLLLSSSASTSRPSSRSSSHFNNSRACPVCREAAADGAACSLCCRRRHPRRPRVCSKSPASRCTSARSRVAVCWACSSSVRSSCWNASTQHHVLVGHELDWYGGDGHHEHHRRNGVSGRDALYSLADLVGTWTSVGVVLSKQWSKEMDVHVLPKLIKFLELKTNTCKIWNILLLPRSTHFQIWWFWF
jgi:hypothetical protein